MKTFIFFFVTLIFFNSCSSDSSPTIMEEVVEEEEMVNEEMMDDDMTMNPSSIYQGDFVSVAHPTMGMVSINPEKTILKIENFKTDSGPLLEMYLATNTSADTYISLGILQGLDGDYEYTLPENVDFDVYKYVIVWCVDFSVNFGHAVLIKN